MRLVDRVRVARLDVSDLQLVVSDADRYSSAFFHGPSLVTPLTPVDLAPEFHERVEASEYHRSTGFMARRDQLLAGERGTSATAVDTYGDQLWNYFLRSYPDIIAARFDR